MFEPNNKKNKVLQQNCKTQLMERDAFSPVGHRSCCTLVSELHTVNIPLYSLSKGLSTIIASWYVVILSGN